MLPVRMSGYELASKNARWRLMASRRHMAGCMKKQTTLLLVIISGLAGCSGAPGTSPACLDASTLEILTAHAEQMRISAELLAGHAGEREATAFFQFPGLELNRSALYAGPLVATCSVPLLYDEYCEEDGLCSRLECTGMGAGWEFHLYLAAATVSGSFRYESASVDTAWADGDDGITFLIASEATGAGETDWSVDGQGRMDTNSLDLEERYPGLVPSGTVTLTLREDETTHSGSIAIDDVAVAEMNPTTGRFTPVGTCG
jgi:hypothetical protein